MKLRSLLHRRRPDRVPPLPLIEADDQHPASPSPIPPIAPPPPIATRRITPLTEEERLERLPTADELELVLEQGIDLDIPADTSTGGDPASTPPHDRAVT